MIVIAVLFRLYKSGETLELNKQRQVYIEDISGSPVFRLEGSVAKIEFSSQQMNNLINNKGKYLILNGDCKVIEKGDDPFEKKSISEITEQGDITLEENMPGYVSVSHYYQVPGFSSFTAPKDCYKLEIIMWGSGGGSMASGAGGFSYGLISAEPGMVFHIEVGSPSIKLLGSNVEMAAGGSRSAIWITNVLNEILVAGGGGGGYMFGGAGGGLNGQNTLTNFNTMPSACGSLKSYPTGGGTQYVGGTAGSADPYTGQSQYGVNGGRNQGSRGHYLPSSWQGFPGGGGYYGGGSGASTCYSAGDGGGGSGFIASTVINGVTVTGNFTRPGNHDHPLRGNAGSPTYNGIVIIKYNITKMYSRSFYYGRISRVVFFLFALFSNR